MKRYLFLQAAFFLFAATSIHAQQIISRVITPAGGTLRSPGIQLNFTIGQIASTTLSSGGLMITQGFQQRFGSTPSLMRLALDEESKEIPTPHPLSVYPNPFTHEITLSTGTEAAPDMQISLSDMTGRQVPGGKSVLITADSRKLELSHLPPGIYYLKVLSAQNQTSKTIRIVKSSN